MVHTAAGSRSCLRFMSFRKEELPLYRDQLKTFLKDDSEAVISAIESGDSSKLPPNFDKRLRILTAKSELGTETVAEISQTAGDCFPADINTLVSAAASQLPSLLLGTLNDSSDVCTLVVGFGTHKEANLHANLYAKLL
jgi:hypothetical protein